MERDDNETRRARSTLVRRFAPASRRCMKESSTRCCSRATRAPGGIVSNADLAHHAAGREPRPFDRLLPRRDGDGALLAEGLPRRKFTLAFLGYARNPEQAEIELTFNWDTASYELGTAYGHVALGVDDIHAVCERIRGAGGKITREPGPMKHGTTVIAFVQDPDGYKIELIEESSRKRA